METVRLKYEDFIESEINNDYFSDTQKYARLGISFSKGKALAFTKEKDAYSASIFAFLASSFKALLRFFSYDL